MYIVIKKSSYITSVLLLSSTVQVNSMQIEEKYDNTQLTSQNDKNQQILDKISNILNNIQIDQTKKEKILSNIRTINNEEKLSFLSNILEKLPDEGKTEKILLNISEEFNNILHWLYEVLERLPEDDVEMQKIILLKMIKMKYIDDLYNLSKVLIILLEAGQTRDILLNIINMDEYTLNWIRKAFDNLPPEQQIKSYALFNVLPNINEINNINTLKEIQSVLRNLPEYAEQGDSFFNTSKNIGKMHEDQLYALSKVLDILPDIAKTEDILLNISNMDEDALINLYLVFCNLPKIGKTKDILINISKMHDDVLYWLHNVFDELPEEEVTRDILINIMKMDRFELLYLYDVLKKLPNEIKTKEILFNISKVNKSILYWLSEVLDKLPSEKITKGVLLNILPNINEMNNINTLREIQSVLRNLPEYAKQRDLFCSIIKNIGKMHEDQLYALSKVLDILPDIAKTEDILLNISNMDKSYLYILYVVLYYSLPENGKTKNILLNISKMQHNSTLYDLHDVLEKLPDAGKTTEILLNISSKNIDKMYESRLFYISKLLDKLPNEVKTTDILLNISKINSFDTLYSLYNELIDTKNNDEKMQILHKYGVLSQQLNK